MATATVAVKAVETTVQRPSGEAKATRIEAAARFNSDTEEARRGNALRFGKGSFPAMTREVRGQTRFPNFGFPHIPCPMGNGNGIIQH